MQELKDYFDTVYSFDTFKLALQASFSILLLALFLRLIISFIKDVFYSVDEWFYDWKKSRKEKKKNKVNLDKPEEIDFGDDNARIL